MCVTIWYVEHFSCKSKTWIRVSGFKRHTRYILGCCDSRYLWRVFSSLVWYYESWSLHWSILHIMFYCKSLYFVSTQEPSVPTGPQACWGDGSFTIYAFATKINVKISQNASKSIRKVCNLDLGALWWSCENLPNFLCNVCVSSSLQLSVMEPSSQGAGPTGRPTPSWSLSWIYSELFNFNCFLSVIAPREPSPVYIAKLTQDTHLGMQGTKEEAEVQTCGAPGTTVTGHTTHAGLWSHLPPLSTFIHSRACDLDLKLHSENIIESGLNFIYLIWKILLSIENKIVHERIRNVSKPLNIAVQDAASRVSLCRGVQTRRCWGTAHPLFASSVGNSFASLPRSNSKHLTSTPEQTPFTSTFWCREADWGRPSGMDWFVLDMKLRLTLRPASVAITCTSFLTLFPNTYCYIFTYTYVSENIQIHYLVQSTHGGLSLFANGETFVITRQQLDSTSNQHEAIRTI